MLLVVDAGNTNITFAAVEGKKIKAIWRIKTDSARTADEYMAFLFQLFQIQKIKFSDITNVLVSSVVPDANFQLRLLSHNAFGVRPKFIGKDIRKLDVIIDVEKPEDVGADRLVNAVAVMNFYKPPAIVVDFGTATTFDIVDERGAFIGGVIAPGVNLSLNALHMAAAKLPKISISKPETAIGRNTVTAMQSGVYWGYVGLVEGMIKRLKKEMGVNPMVIATGGLAPLFHKAIPVIDRVDEDLTLKGLLAISQQKNYT